jgi:hypothetical protein
MRNLSPIKEMREKSPSVIDSTHCINKITARSGSNNVDHTSEEVYRLTVNIVIHFTSLFTSN